MCIEFIDFCRKQKLGTVSFVSDPALFLQFTLSKANAQTTAQEQKLNDRRSLGIRIIPFFLKTKI